jgi:tRNA threonylcarbamoyladenosine biosynthesis protein TsaB
VTLKEGRGREERQAPGAGSGFILAMDTSTALASAALYDGAVRGELTWRAGRNHSTELMVQVENMLRLCRVSPGQLVAVAVATGPGSYTGLRVGLAAAKGFCLALSIPLIGVCTLDALAEAHIEACIPVRPLLDAGRQRYATALYMRRDGMMEKVSPLEGKRMPELLAMISERTLLCGDISAETVLNTAPDSSLLEVASPAASLRRAGYLAEIGWRRYHEGDVQNPAEVTAIYLSGEEV